MPLTPGHSPSDRVLILERDPTAPAVWRYGLGGDNGQLVADAYRLRHDPEAGSEPIGDCAEMLWPTVVLLVRQAGGHDRIVYDLTMRPADVPEPPPRGPERRWERSTAGKSKGRGETLSERAQRDREGQPLRRDRGA